MDLITHFKYWRGYRYNELGELEELIQKSPITKEGLSAILKNIYVQFEDIGVSDGTTIFIPRDDEPEWFVSININLTIEEQKMTLAHELVHVFYGISGRDGSSAEPLVEREAIKLYKNETAFINKLFEYYKTLS